MRGLIYRDLISFFRRTHIGSWFFDIIFVMIFLFIIPGAGAVPTYLLLVQPINMSGAAATLKELDTNYSGRVALTFPVTHSQHVLSRFISSYIIFGIHVIESIVFTLLHYVIKSDFELSTYIFYLLSGILIGVVLMAVNILSSYIMGLNATAIMYLFSMIFIGALYVAYWIFDINIIAFINLSKIQILIAGTVCAGLILLTSYLISKKIYLNQF